MMLDKEIVKLLIEESFLQINFYKINLICEQEQVI